MESGLVWYFIGHEHRYWSVHASGCGESNGHHQGRKYSTRAHLCLVHAVYGDHVQRPALGDGISRHRLMAARILGVCHRLDRLQTSVAQMGSLALDLDEII